MNLQINESTPTRHVPRPSEPEGTQDGDVERRFPSRDTLLKEGQTLDMSVPETPPEHLLLDVVMTFVDDKVRLNVPDALISAEGRSVQEAFRYLVVAAKDYIAAAEGEEASLMRYEPHTWFRFVSPDQARDQHLETDFWPEGEDVEDFIAAATEGRYEEEEDEPNS